MEKETQKLIMKRAIVLFDVLLKDSGKTDLDSQIKTIEKINESLIETPLFLGVIQSLKELRAIKLKNNLESAESYLTPDTIRLIKKGLIVIQK